MSNIYPAWWDTTITIYNRYEDPQTQVVTWYRNVINDCFWQNVSDKILVSKTLLETNNIICRIPKQINFLESYEWNALPAQSKSEYFTLCMNDIIVKGEVTDSINEYVSGSRSNDMLNKYKKLQGCMQVETYSINTGTSKGSEHYFIRGV